MVAVPDVGAVRPTMARIVVDLPAPLGAEETGHAAGLGGEGEVVDGGETGITPGQ